MVRIWIATALLIGFIVAVKFGLNQALAAWGFGPYMAACAVVTSGAIAAAFAYDHATTHSQQSPLRELNDRPPSMK